MGTVAVTGAGRSRTASSRSCTANFGGDPDRADASKCAPDDEDRSDFQYWALTLVGARPVEVAKGKPKKGADKGIDGTITFLGENPKAPHRCIVQVKSGHVSSATIRELKGTVEREKAELGLLITLENPTSQMTVEALEAGFYHSDWINQEYPRMQIITIGELLKGQQPKIPPRYNPYQLAQFQKKPGQQPSLFEQEG